MSNILRSAPRFLALIAVAILCASISKNPASASDICMAAAPKEQRPKPYHYQDFYSGWKALTYSFERIAEASASGNENEFARHLLRVCAVTEGLKSFATQIRPEARQDFLVSLNVSQGIVGALEDARAAHDLGKYPKLLHQLDTTKTALSDAVPQCWLSLSSTLHGRDQVACR